MKTRYYSTANAKISTCHFGPFYECLIHYTLLFATQHGISGVWLKIEKQMSPHPPAAIKLASLLVLIFLLNRKSFPTYLLFWVWYQRHIICSHTVLATIWSFPYPYHTIYTPYMTYYSTKLSSVWARAPFMWLQIALEPLPCHYAAIGYNSNLQLTWRPWQKNKHIS